MVTFEIVLPRLQQLAMLWQVLHGMAAVCTARGAQSGGVVVQENVPYDYTHSKPSR